MVQDKHLDPHAVERVRADILKGDGKSSCSPSVVILCFQKDIGGQCAFRHRHIVQSPVFSWYGVPVTVSDVSIFNWTKGYCLALMDDMSKS